MKIIETFTDLDKALSYITSINEAFKNEAEAKKAEADKSKLLEKDLSNKEKEILDLVKERDGLRNVENALKADLATKDGLLIVAEEQRDLALTEVGELSKKLDLQEKFGSQGMVVTVLGKSFTLVGDTFLYGGSKKTAEELSKDQAQLEWMVENGSGALVAID